ncbi:hypothetical protein FPQ18DRAFT_303865 [Pyronema domesticum]|uniref:Uncharacterized protein n=1 Tax=Pyronema omphalodes (strain CBS 100304) TaxID=1076935 RepID=U4LGR8_PYROM|nr:hypothetical protein FPQ18DRAFT_303865 [Pyronema domesticum]CCX10939.1 Protein of unknown function [Pyronema omphalodes CBS 100304]
MHLNTPADTPRRPLNNYAGILIEGASPITSTHARTAQNPQVVSQLSVPLQVENSEHIFRNHSTVRPTRLVEPEVWHNVSRSTLESELQVLRENLGVASSFSAGLSREEPSIANHAAANETPRLTLENLQQLDNNPLHGLEIWLLQGKKDDATRFYQG